MQPHRSRLEMRHHLRSRQRRLHLLAWASTILFGGFVLGIVILIGAFIFLSRDLPNPNKLSSRENEELSTKIYDRNGELLYDIFSNKNRTLVTIDQIPKNLQQATISIEDKDFYKHKGFDLMTLVRIPYGILFRHQLAGGSTLTQQLIKMTLLSPERTATRKLKEFVLAVQAESKYSKQEILQMYLNEAPYGGAAVGVEVAA